MKKRPHRPRPAETVRVLLVDDEIDELERQAGLLLQADPLIFLGTSLKIEVTNSAYFAAGNLLRQRRLRWDVVIADVFMPPPKPRPGGATEDTADVDRLIVGSTTIPFFKYNGLAWAAPSNATPDDGGMRIAELVRARRVEERTLTDLRVILVSRFVNSPIQGRIQELRSSEGEWFDYFDKAYWLVANKPGALEPQIYVLALAQAIANRHSKAFGSAALAGTKALAGAFVRRSPVMQEIEVEARGLANSPTVNNVWLSGERGVGRRTVANLIHRHRMETLAITDGTLVDFNAAIPEHEFEPTLLGKQVVGPRTSSEIPGALQAATNGTLLIRNVERLRSPYQWDLLVQILRRGEIRRRDGHIVSPDLVQMVVLSTTDPDARSLMSMFDADLLHELQVMARIEIPPLRQGRQMDIPLFAIEAVRQERSTLTLAPSTETFLQAQAWDAGNIDQLVQVVTMAARRETGPVLRLAAVRHATDQTTASHAIHGRSTSKPKNFAQWPPRGVILEHAERALSDAETYLRELQTIAREVLNARADPSFDDIRKRFPSCQVIPRLTADDIDELRTKGVQPSTLALKFAGMRYGELAGERPRSAEAMRDWRERRSAAARSKAIPS